MFSITKVHHIAVICSDYAKSKDFYHRLLGFSIIREVYREERKSYKLDLDIDGRTQLELFSFEQPPARFTRPEARGLRHLAFEVTDIEQTVKYLRTEGVRVEDIRLDPHTEKRFTFFFDPDELPLEIYEQ